MGETDSKKRAKDQDGDSSPLQATGVALEQNSVASSLTSGLNPLTVSNWIRSTNPAQSTQAALLDRIARNPAGLQASSTVSLHDSSQSANPIARILSGGQGSLDGMSPLANLQDPATAQTSSSGPSILDLLRQLQPASVEATAAHLHQAELSVAQIIQERARQQQQQASYESNLAASSLLYGLGSLSTSQGLQNAGFGNILDQPNLLRQLQQQAASNTIPANFSSQVPWSSSTGAAELMGAVGPSATNSNLSALLLQQQQQQQQNQITQLQQQLLLENALRSTAATGPTITATPRDALIALLLARSEGESFTPREQEQKDSP